MSGYCKDCGNQYCICDNINSHPEIRNNKRMLREGILKNPEDLEWRDFTHTVPIITGKYLTYPHYRILEYTHNAFYSDSGMEYVTHWMCLPKPPKVTK